MSTPKITLKIVLVSLLIVVVGVIGAHRMYSSPGPYGEVFTGTEFFNGELQFRCTQSIPLQKQKVRRGQNDFIDFIYPQTYIVTFPVDETSFDKYCYVVGAV